MTVNILNITSNGLQNFNATTGDFTAIDLTTKGDLLAFDGTNYQRFPVGNDGYVLRADSSQPVGLRWACTHFEFLASQTASSSSTIEFTNFADSDCFSGYRLVWKNATRTGGTFGLRLRFSIDNGSSWLSSLYKTVRDTIRDDTGDELILGQTSATSIEINNHNGSSSNVSFNGEAFFYTSVNPSTTLVQGLITRSTTLGGNAQLVRSNSYSIHPTTSEINGFQFFMSSGTITSGEFYLYGVLKE